jgi:hypothetical protein
VLYFYLNFFKEEVVSSREQVSHNIGIISSSGTSIAKELSSGPSYKVVSFYWIGSIFKIWRRMRGSPESNHSESLKAHVQEAAAT